jgi:hypothetical protein
MGARLDRPGPHGVLLLLLISTHLQIAFTASRLAERLSIAGRSQVPVTIPHG